MNIFPPHATDGYKLGHPAQYVSAAQSLAMGRGGIGTQTISSNYTPRDFGHANITPDTATGKMVYVGLTYAIKQRLIKDWNDNFFSKPKAEVMARYARRIKGYLGTNQGQAAQEMMGKLHDLGYLPIRIRSLPEGSRVNPGIPVFTVTNTLPEFYGLVNYLETVLSNTVWPMCNAASLTEQYWLNARKYGKLTGASEEFWLPLAGHNFALRGHRGLEDGVMSAFAFSLFFKGSDTFLATDFAEDYYGATDNDVVCVSVNASEHATVCQQIKYHGGDELEALKYFLTEVYPTGVFSYVADSRDYWDVIGRIIPALKDVIMARGPNVDGQPGVLTVRPDSSPDTPYEIIMGYNVFESDHVTVDAWNFGEGDESGYAYDAVRVDGRVFRASTKYTCNYPGDESKEVVLGRELNEFEAKGTLQCLWDTFGGTEWEDDTGAIYRTLDSHIRIIYGEAISLQMQRKIYQAMYDRGWSVGSLFMGIGSWGFLANSSRDSYGIAMKATNSQVDDKEYALHKDPKGTSVFKKSAEGRLRVEMDVDKNEFVLFQNQTPVEEDRGYLQVVFEDGHEITPIVHKSEYVMVVDRIKNPSCWGLPQLPEHLR